MKDPEKLYILDSSLKINKDLNYNQKIELAKLLQKLNVNAIEISIEDSELASILKQEIKQITVAVSATLTKDKLDQALEFLKGFEKPRIRLVLDPKMLEDFDISNRQVKADIIQMLKESITYAKKSCDDIEFVAVKFNKLHKVFLFRILDEAAESGVNTITITDYENNLLPEEYGILVAETIENLPEFENLIIGVSCKSYFSNGSANTLTSITKGARQVEANALIKHNDIMPTSLKNLIKAFEGRKDIFNPILELNKEELSEILKAINSL